MSNRERVTAYWLPEVGIGPTPPGPGILPGTQTFTVPLSDVLKYRRRDGSLQIDVVNLAGAAFTMPTLFPRLPITLAPQLKLVLEDGTVKALQAAGVKVVLTIAGTGGNSVGWSSIPKSETLGFVQYLDRNILGPDGYGLDGIDIDDEYGTYGDTLLHTLKLMRGLLPEEKTISKALWADQQYFPAIVPFLSYGATMNYGDSPEALKSFFMGYVESGMPAEKILVGVNAGPVRDSGAAAFTSVETARKLAEWRPPTGRKMG